MVKVDQWLTKNKEINMTKWITAGDNKHGLRYREHETRTIGVGRSKRPLRYYSTVFKWRGKVIADAYGWENEFRGGANDIEMLALQFKTNRKAKTPPFTYKDYIQEREQGLLVQKQAEQDETEKQERRDRIKFKNLFKEYCEAHADKVSIRDECSYNINWIEPTIGDKRLDEIKLLDLERIKKKMTDAGRAPRSVAYIKSIVRQVYHYAIEHELYDRAPPTQYFLKKQKLNNQRKRYLTPEEVSKLLAEIGIYSQTTYRITQLSMNTGMRFGEIAALLWQHINTDQGYILVMDPKNNEGRTVHMNEAVQDMFASMKQGDPHKWVFPSNRGTKMTRVSHTFTRSVNNLGFNDGITDRRMKVVFHTLRHSCASWLANSGVDMQVVGKVLGHKTLAMTMRYSHINDDSVKGAMKILDQQAKNEEKIIPLQRSS